MEVIAPEEKKKIFRAKKTMRISDRTQLEILHNTLTGGSSSSSSNPSPPPLVNGTHKEDGQKVSDKEQSSTLDSNSPHPMSPVSPASRGSPVPSLSLNLSPSPPPLQSPKAKEDAPTPPISPFHCLNFELKKMEEEGNKASSLSSSNDGPASASPDATEGEKKDSEVIAETEKKEETHTTTEGPVMDSVKDSTKGLAPPASPASPAGSGGKSDTDHVKEFDCTEPMEEDEDEDTTEEMAPEASTAKQQVEKPPSPKASTSPPSPQAPSPPAPASPPPEPASSLTALTPDADIKDEEMEEEEEEEEEELKEEVKDVQKDKQKAKQGLVKMEKTNGSVKLEKDASVKVEKKDASVKVEKKDASVKVEKKDGSVNGEKMEVDSVKVEKVETKKEKNAAGQSMKPSRPSSTPPSDTAVQEKSSTSGLKRTLSEGSEKDVRTVERDGKRPKVEDVELEAQLELKITGTAKGGSHIKIAKVVQQLVEEQLRGLEQTVFDQSLQELKGRLDKIECATKHQTAINTLQAKIVRLAKKFGEANQLAENKRKQEALAAATAAATTAAANAAYAANAVAAAKTTAAANTAPTQRPVRTSMEIKQTTPTLALASTAAPTAQPIPQQLSVPTSSAMSQASIVQLITSTSNAVNSLAGGITTQSPMGTLLLKTSSGTGMMGQGQPLYIQMPQSMNGQTMLVNIPVSSLSAVSSLNKPKTTTPTATFILKQAPAASSQASITVPALQASPGQMPPTQISLARAVYQGGTGGITTPNAGVSVTTARTPAQSVSVAGAMSSTSSPATSGPAATGSTAPGPLQGTSMTSKTDNQATGSTPGKAAAPGVRPKGSVIDLTEDDDDVQVTGVVAGGKNATVPTPASQRSHPVVSIPTNPSAAGARSSPQTISTFSNSSNPQLTVHHRPPLDSPSKSRTVTTAPARAPPTTMALPPLPAAPLPPSPASLPPGAAQTSLPQQPQLKLVPSATGIVLSWCVNETDRTCAPVDSYHLYAFHQDNSPSNAAQQHWKKIGEVKALPLPMACTLTQFQSGSTYHFAVRAKDVYGRYGSFCDPQCTNVINSSST